MATQLSSVITLPWGQVIGAPIVALIEAEALAAQASTEFITSVGFAPQNIGRDNHIGKLKTITFTYYKQDVNGKTVVDEVSIPLLSLIPLPLLQIKSASLEFSLMITDVEKIERSSKTEQPESFFQKTQYGFVGTVGSTSSNEEIRSNVDMKVKVNLVQSDVPAGLQKLFMIMDSAAYSKVLPYRRA